MNVYGASPQLMSGTDKDVDLCHGILATSDDVVNTCVLYTLRELYQSNVIFFRFNSEYFKNEKVINKFVFLSVIFLVIGRHTPALHPGPTTHKCGEKGLYLCLSYK